MNETFLARITRADTIAAPATIVGRSALAVVRVSGPRCGEILATSFRGMDGAALEAPEPRRAYLGWWMADAERLDQVTVVYYAAPASYTGEAMLELTGHGGRAAVAAVLSSLVARGARLADPGEFTLRAFLAGKLDLSEAEAIEEMVGARNERARRLALRQLSGDLSRLLAEMRAQLTDAAVEVESALEFPDEELRTGQRARLAELLTQLAGRAERLLAAASREALYQRGHAIVLLGRPNTGKSTLLNAIIGRERALVTSIAGTTRDLLEEELLIGGRVCTLIDGAGLHDTRDVVERLGIERLKAVAHEAWAWLLIVESGPAEQVERAVEELLSELPESSCQKYVVLTKTDLHAPGASLVVAQRLVSSVSRDAAPVSASLCAVLPVCALSGEGIDGLLSALETALGEAPPPEGEDAFLLSERQRAGLAQLAASLAENRRMVDEGATLDLLAEGLRASHASLGELMGENARPDLLAEIFGRFCIGK